MQREWIEVSGHNSEGDQYHDMHLVDTTGRILATIELPMKGTREYVCQFHCDCYGGQHWYIELEPAQKYCEEAVDRLLEREEREQKRREEPARPGPCRHCGASAHQHAWPLLPPNQWEGFKRLFCREKAK